MEDNEEKFFNNPKMRIHWSKRTYNTLRKQWEDGYKDFFSFPQYLNGEYQSLWSDWDEAEGMGADDDELVEQFPREYPIINEMYHQWGYEIEFAIVEYMDIVRELDENSVNENRTTIKKILREQFTNTERMVGLASKDMIKTFKSTSDDLIQPSLYHKLRSWVNDIGRDFIKTRYGITESEVITNIENIFYAHLLNLPIVGSRISLIRMDDKWSKLQKGDEGEVMGYNSTPWGATMSMRWDNGSRVVIVPTDDDYKVLSNS